MNPANNGRRTHWRQAGQWVCRLKSPNARGALLTFAFALLLTGIGAAASAAPICDAPYCLDIWTAGGTGQSSGGGFMLSGSLSQIGSAESSGGSFSVSGGFWAAVNTTSTPTPTATRTPTPLPTQTLVPTSTPAPTGVSVPTATPAPDSTSQPSSGTLFLPFVQAEVPPVPTPGTTTCISDPIGESSNIGDAIIICSGQTVTGLVSQTDRDDVFRIWVETGQRLTIGMDGTGGDADLYLYSPDAIDVNTDYAVAGSISSGNSEFIDGTVLTSGHWYIAIYSYEGATDYRLTANVALTAVTLSLPQLSGSVAESQIRRHVIK